MGALLLCFGQKLADSDDTAGQPDYKKALESIDFQQLAKSRLEKKVDAEAEAPAPTELQLLQAQADIHTDQLRARLRQTPFLPVENVDTFISLSGMRLMSTLQSLLIRCDGFERSID